MFQPGTELGPCDVSTPAPWISHKGCTERWDNGQGEQIRCGDRKGRCQGKGNEQVLNDPGQKDSRQEDGKRRGRAGKDRTGHLAGPIASRLQGRFTHSLMPDDVFNDDNPSIDDRTNRQRQTSQGHDVDGIFTDIERNEGGDDGNWDGNGNDQSRLPGPKKSQENDHCQKSTVIDRRTHVLDR